jgi:hypothetical protein
VQVDLGIDAGPHRREKSPRRGRALENEYGLRGGKGLTDGRLGKRTYEAHGEHTQTRDRSRRLPGRRCIFSRRHDDDRLAPFPLVPNHASGASDPFGSRPERLARQLDDAARRGARLGRLRAVVEKGRDPFRPGHLHETEVAREGGG